MAETEIEFWLIKRRKELNIRQVDLARLLKIKLSTVARWEMREQLPLKVDLIHSLAEILEMPVAEVLIQCGYKAKYTFGDFRVGSLQYQIYEYIAKATDAKNRTVLKVLKLMYQEIDEYVIETQDLEDID